MKKMNPVLAGDKIALVKIEGLTATAEKIVEELNHYADDSSIKAIVIRVDSPGGGVVASQEIYNAVKTAKKSGKKVVVSMGALAASGGYYIAAPADKIMANPGTLTGSIGVIMGSPCWRRSATRPGSRSPRSPTTRTPGSRASCRPTTLTRWMATSRATWFT